MDDRDCRVVGMTRFLRELDGGEPLPQSLRAARPRPPKPLRVRAFCLLRNLPPLGYGLGQGEPMVESRCLVSG